MIKPTALLAAALLAAVASTVQASGKSIPKIKWDIPDIEEEVTPVVPVNEDATPLPEQVAPAPESTPEQVAPPPEPEPEQQTVAPPEPEKMAPVPEPEPEPEQLFPDIEDEISNTPINENAITKLLNSRATSNTKDYIKAAETIAADAAAGKPVQQYLVAIFSEDRNAPQVLRVPEDTRNQYLKSSRSKIRSLAERKNNPLAWYLLSLENNDLSILQKAVNGGNVQALNAYGTILLTDAISNPDITPLQFHAATSEALGYFRRAAELNDMNGIYNLAMCYMRGYGIEENPKKACELFLKAARHNHPEAINNIGGFLRDGIVVKKNVTEAVKWFKRSANLQNVYGMTNYALALQRGEGVEQDLPAAAEIFREAAQYDCPEAINAYGMCLLRGEGVEKNEAEALAQFHRSATYGYPIAMENISSCYERGLCGLERDAHTAFIWKVKARAARGDRNAALWLRQNGHSNK